MRWRVATGPAVYACVLTACLVLATLGTAGCASGGRDAEGRADATPTATAKAHADAAHADRQPGGQPAGAGGRGGGTAANATDRPGGVIEHGPRDRRQVALTFDADMTPDTYAEARAGGSHAVNHAVLGLLRRRRVPATVFVTGLWARANPGLVRRLVADPRIELGGHTFDHSAWEPDCYGLASIAGVAAKRRELRRTAASVRRAGGGILRWFRFPGLCHSPADVRLVARHGVRAVDGDVISGDAFNADPAAIADTVVDRARPGSIVVMHLNGAPNAPVTAEALRTIVPRLRARRLRLVTLSRLLDEP